MESPDQFSAEINSMSDKSIDAFLSYASNDLEKAKRLVAELRKGGLRVWFDQDEVMPGDDIDEQISGGISRARHYVLCLSPSFEKRPPTSWVRKEFKRAILKESKLQKNCIVPVRLKNGCSVPDEIGGRAFADLSTKKRWFANMSRLVDALKR
jgi:hypothetical protein